MIAGRIIPAIATTTASVTGLVMMEMMKVLQRKPVEKLRNGNYSLGTNSYMMFEANPPQQKKTEVVVTNPDPKQYPDAYDEKGNLKAEYKDPELMLGFAEWAKKYPDPHTKYDTFWVDNTADMTVAQLKAAVDAIFAEAKLKVSSISCPPMRVEAEDEKGNPTVRDSARAMWNSSIKSTNANLEKKWVPLLTELTTRSEDFACIDDPVDVTGKLLYAGLTITLEDDDYEQVEQAPLVLKLGEFDFVPYNERPPKPAVPWL
jgi:hypothetical protein